MTVAGRRLKAECATAPRAEARRTAYLAIERIIRRQFNETDEGRALMREHACVDEDLSDEIVHELERIGWTPPGEAS